jgi:hypothetical protein
MGTRVLENGIIVRRPEKDRFEDVVEIDCTVEEPKLCSIRQSGFVSPSSHYIEKATAASRDS